ncbi:MAG TPA: sugar ABC transporter permease [Clostridiaceae bacterium]|nr:sugar ABC transporter permease [Clostridiaceae bacterium]
MHKRDFAKELYRNKTLFLMMLPTLIYLVIFSYIPMVGIYYAFTKYDFEGGLFGSQFVGLKNFEFMFKSGTLGLLTRNTVLYNLAFIITGNIMEIICAILLSEINNKWFKKITQSAMFLPYFISMVLVGVFAYNLFNVDNGVINTIIKSLGFKPYSFYTNPGPWKYILVIFKVWKGLGYGTVIYLAAIMGISEEYYEAAKIDGANIFKQIWYITLPLLKPTVVILVLLSLGGILKGQFDLFYQIIGNNGLLYETTDIIDTYVYRALTVNFDIGMGTAAGLYQSFFGFILVMTVNYIIKKIEPDYSLF